MINNIIDFIKDKKILILGFGREGKSSYSFIRRHLGQKKLYIADQLNVDLEDENVTLICGDDYLDNLDDYDLIIKTPGISFKGMDISSYKEKLYSQLEIFLKFIPNKIIGITGTKGKSTTSSLIYKVLVEQGKDALLLGNIGTPLFDMIESIKEDTILVIEMSSHQLEFITKSPNIAIMTNLYQEHLDHYNSFDDYIAAKFNICKNQDITDYFIYNDDDELIKENLSIVPSNKIGVSINEAIPSEINNPKMLGNSSKYNIKFTLAIVNLMNLDIDRAIKSINKFETLSHRMEYVGTFNGVKFYDDAIATIPEATINSVEALKEVDTLIFGGMDRGVNLDSLIEYLNKGIVRNLICMPQTGYKVADNLTNKNINIFKVETMEEAVELAFRHTLRNKICLLAPAAASYNIYKNFEEKGNHYKELIREKTTN